MILQIKRFDHGEKRIYFWCPACSDLHWVSVDRPDWTGWRWNGDEEDPTFNPSLRVWRYYEVAGKRLVDVCHFFVRDGVIEYLDDCTHRMKNQSVAMVDIPAGTFIK